MNLLKRSLEPAHMMTLLLYAVPLHSGLLSFLD